MAAIDNYFALEPIIVQHIKDRVDGLLAVDTPFDIDNMLEFANVAPSVSVIYYGDRMGESSSNGKVSTQYQQWLIVLKVRDSKAQGRDTNELCVPMPIRLSCRF